MSKTKYIMHTIKLTEGQIRKLEQGWKFRAPTTIQLTGNGKNYDFTLTQTQVNRIQKTGGKCRLKISMAQLNAFMKSKTKEGGFLPLIPLIIGGLTAAGTVAGASAGIADAVHNKKAQDKQIAEQKRHNKVKESEAAKLRDQIINLKGKQKVQLGHGFYLGKKGEGFYLGKGAAKKKKIQ